MSKVLTALPVGEKVGDALGDDLGLARTG